jgi:succinate dehydrogenase / fumarate reductase, membrane anchor subunit
MSVTIETPRSPIRPVKRGINWEKWGWVYMRASGIVLVVLIFGHLFVNLMVGEGVKAIDFAFVAGKFTDPFLGCLGHRHVVACFDSRGKRYADAGQ